MFVLGNAKRNIPSLAFVLIPVAILLAGCANQPHFDSQTKEDKAAAEQSAKETGTIDDVRCQSYGFQPSSAGYAQCRKDIDSERKQTGIK
jgi:hypothetical protein